jgi:hypothetical protein
VIIDHTNKQHQTTVNLAESGKQVALDAARKTFIAGGGGPAQQAAYDAATKTADAAFYRACIASCVANGVPGEATFRQSLHDVVGVFS